VIHLRVGAWFDEQTGESSNGKIACGLETLPEGDTWVYEGDAGAYHAATCLNCNPSGPRPFGTPISQLSGRPHMRGFEAFQDISKSWGYD
jgi:hypothetical protein